MSRIGKKIIAIPEKTEVKVSDGLVHVKGPLGELSRQFKHDVEIVIEGKEISLKPRKNTIDTRALWGTVASHVMNMLKGVNQVFQKKLIIEGVGYKWEVKGQDLQLALGFSHPVKLAIPKGIKVVAEKNILTITGIDKEVVGQFAAEIRSLKKPEPYKGKGIRYDSEVIKRKQGKKSV